MRFLLWFIFIALGLLLITVILMGGADTTIPEYPVAKIEPHHKSRLGLFKLDVRTADDNEYIDWWNKHSDMPAFWKPLGEKELEIFLWSKDEHHNLDQRPEFSIGSGIQYGDFMWNEMLEVFQDDFIDGKYKDYTIVRAWDEYGLLTEFDIHPPILNVPYKWHTEMLRLSAIHKSWWCATFPVDTIVFNTDHFWSKYNSLSGIEQARYWQSFRDSFVLTYGDGEKKRDAIVHFQVNDKKWLHVSFACDTGQAVNVKIQGYLPKPSLSFMTRTAEDAEVFEPSDPDGASITFNSPKQKVLYYSFTPNDDGWDVVLHTKLKLKQSDVRVSANCKVKDFKSYPHMGGKFETDFEVDAEFESMSIIFPNLKRPLIIFGDKVINSNKE